VRCGISIRSKSAPGQKHALPHCNSNGRFTSISGHKTANSVWRDGTGAQEISARPYRVGGKVAREWYGCLSGKNLEGLKRSPKKISF
jgi:hypothetical protein